MSENDKFLAYINAHAAENAIEARHEATLKRLREKHRTLQPHETVGKTVKSVSGYSWDCMVVFTDNTYLQFESGVGHEGEREIDYISLDLDDVKTKGLMAAEDIPAYDEAEAYFEQRAEDAEDSRVLHQAKSRFGVEKLKELLGCS